MAELKSHEVLAKISTQIMELKSTLPQKYIIELKWVDTFDPYVKTSADETNFLNQLYNNSTLNITAMWNPNIALKKFYPLSTVWKDSTYLYLEFFDYVEYYLWQVKYNPDIGVLYFIKKPMGDEIGETGPIGSESSLVIYSF